MASKPDFFSKKEFAPLPDTTTSDGLKALGELGKDEADKTTGPHQLGPHPIESSSPRQADLIRQADPTRQADPARHADPTAQAGSSERDAWRTAPFDLSIPAIDIPIVPGIGDRAGQQRDRRDKRNEPGQTPAGIDAAVQTYSVFDIPWQDRLLDCLLKMKPASFERLCQRILKDAGFIKVEVTGRNGDGGIDGIGVLRLNLLSFHVFFQCKRWKGSVGASTIRDFRGAMVGRADKGLVLTTGTFTVEARKEATRDGAPAIDLVDGETLCELLKKLKIGVSIRMVEHILVEQEAFLEF
jgi:restriction system protein